MLSNSARVSRHGGVNQNLTTMNKTIIIIGIALGAVLITGVVLALVAPSRIAVTSTQFIRASRQSVYDQLRLMKNFPKWSPFLAQDPEQRYAISGNDGQVGATFSWEGVKEKSKGLQRVVGLKENEAVRIQCVITAPFQAQPQFNYSLTERPEGVEVRQEFEVAMPFPANVFGLVFNLKETMAKTNRAGLALLKKVTEQEQLTLSSN